MGKSNLFDAIRFLSALAEEKTFREAAMKVRDNNGTPSAIKSLFHRHGTYNDNKMTFEAEMIIPKEGIDDFGQEFEAGNTFLRYSLELGFNKNINGIGGIELLKEELAPIEQNEASNHLLFSHEKSWRDSIIIGDRKSPLISTEDARIIVHLDSSIHGAPLGKANVTLEAKVDKLQNTMISTANAAGSFPMRIAKKEMQSWKIFSLEPSALREPDKFGVPSHPGENGTNLPSTVYRIATATKNNESRVYQEIANRLKDLIDDVSNISVDRDDKRELMTLELTDRNGTKYAARDLSDGTLRFLAAATILADEQMQGLICFEEPENGIHPARIPAMIELLMDIAVDAELPVEEGNPLRQVIINTHSPAVVAQVPDDCLLFVELRETIKDKKRFKASRFSWLSDTWRAKQQPEIRPEDKGTILSFLNPVPYEDDSGMSGTRVIDREDLQEYLPFYPED